MKRAIRILRPADLLNVLFLLLLSSLVVYYRDTISNAAYLITLYSVLIMVQLWLMRSIEEGATRRLFHALIFPTVSIVLVFESLEGIVHYINPVDLDPWLIRMDYMLLGFYPTVELEKMMSPLLTDILQLAYASYYFIPLSLGVVLYREDTMDIFDKALFMIMLCFYLSYAGYLLFPALGPRYAMAHLQTRELEGFVLSGSIQNLLNSLEGIKRDAFPSGHTGVALTSLYYAFRFQRRLFAVLVPLVAALVFSTVYCRYHYVIDVIGGVILTLITIAIGELLYGYYKQRIYPAG